MRTILLVAAASALLAACGSTEKLLGAGSDPDYDAAIDVASRDGNKTVSAGEALQFGLTEETYHRASRGSNQPLDRKAFREAIKYQFDKSDMNRDDRLSATEAIAAGLRSGRPFARGDRNDNQYLSLSEYVRALTAQARSTPARGQ